MVYGLEVAEEDDRYMTAFDECVETVELLDTSSLFEYFPILASIPTWLPGSSRIRRIRQAHHLTERFRSVPFIDGKKRLVG